MGDQSVELSPVKSKFAFPTSWVDPEQFELALFPKAEFDTRESAE